MRIATYIRISTDEDRQPFSLGAQAERLEAYASSQDSWRIVRRFTDQASGATLERPGLRQALSEAAAGVYELLLVYRVDRLSRSVRQLAQTAEELERSGVALRSATEPFDTSSPAGKMMLQMLGVFAEFERATIVERITAGMERAASQGRWVVGKVPYGYLRVKETNHPHEPQADVVRRIFAMYVKGRMGAESIAKVLNVEGHRTKNGQVFARPIVLSILSNPIYAGRIEFRGLTHPGLHEPIVDTSTFAAAGRILAERGESQALRRAHPTEYLLSGVIRCGRCRRAYVGTSAHGRKGLYQYYVCSTRYRYGTEHCHGERLPKDALEEAVIDQMQEIYGNSSLIERALADANVEEGELAEDTGRRLTGIRQQVAGAKRSLDRYFAAFEEGSLSPADCQERIAKLKARIDALMAEEASLNQQTVEGASDAPSALDVAEWAKDLGTLLRAGTVQQRKALFRLLVKELRVMSREEILPTYKVPALVRVPEGQVD
ncbi:MAG: recombinase family protein, partial [Candidatus Velamenicoccus archaeovorus]